MRHLYLPLAVTLAFLAAACVPASAPQAGATMPPVAGQCGRASWYQMTSRTASGERANPNSMAAAHRTLPFGTKVKVENLNNGRTAVVRINDRGPFVRGRVIDVTRAAADELGFRSAGHAPVRVTVLDDGVQTVSSC